MSDKSDSANLILKLYELRREEVMRKARSWYVMEFHPASPEDVSAAATGEHSAYFRMVTTYWDMAASLVINGGIEEQMFNDANGEQFAVFCKLAPFISEIRRLNGRPTYLQHLERLVMNAPKATERMTSLREYFKNAAAAQAAKV